MPRLDFKTLASAQIGGPKIVSAAATLNACDVLVEAVPPTSSTYIIKLPPLGDALYYPYTVYTPTNDTGTVTVNSAEGTTMGLLTAAADQIVVLPTATCWILLHDTTT